VDDGQPARVGFEICAQQGCRAGMVLKEPVLKAMKAGKEAKATIVSPQGKEVGIPISLSGFTAAIGSLK